MKVRHAYKIYGMNLQTAKVYQDSLIKFIIIWRQSKFKTANRKCKRLARLLFHIFVIGNDILLRKINLLLLIFIILREN